MTVTFYRRPLPADAIAFSSPEGRRVFAEALAAGGLDGWFPLAEQFHTQADPAFCGLGSLVVALNALGVDPGRLWKGPWRWFGEELLDCCVSLERVRARGLDLDELACLARCNGAVVELERPELGEDRWRDALAAASRGAIVLVAAYDRATLGQTGSGHFSPIAGHHPGRDLALVLDVARFKYPPHWVPAARMFEAMRPIDPATGRSRGWLRLRPRPGVSALGFSLRCDGEPLGSLAGRLDAAEAELAAAPDVGAAARALAPLARSVEVREPAAAQHREALAAMRAQLASTAAFAAVASSVGADDAEVVTLLLLALAERAPAGARAPLAPATGAPDGDLAAVVAQLREQVEALRRVAPRAGGRGG